MAISVTQTTQQNIEQIKQELNDAMKVIQEQRDMIEQQQQYIREVPTSPHIGDNTDKTRDITPRSSTTESTRRSIITTTTLKSVKPVNLSNNTYKTNGTILSSSEAEGDIQSLFVNPGFSSHHKYVSTKDNIMLDIIPEPKVTLQDNIDLYNSDDDDDIYPESIQNHTKGTVM